MPAASVKPGGENLRGCAGNHSDPQLSGLLARVARPVSLQRLPGRAILDGERRRVGVDDGDELEIGQATCGVGTVYCDVTADVEKNPSV